MLNNTPRNAKNGFMPLFGGNGFQGGYQTYILYALWHR